MVEPLSTPAGTFMVSVRLLSTLPVPPQSLQRSSIMVPSPWHLSQVRTVSKRPRAVFCLYLTWPVPPHLSHVLGEVPGFAPLPAHVSHFSLLLTLISFVMPKAASSNP